MGDPVTPRSSDWNRFWKADKINASDRVSWSKRRMIRVLEPFAREGKKVLDAGCGSGFFAKYFCDHQMETVALDYSEDALRIARQKTGGRVRTVRADLLTKDVVDAVGSRFDVIFSDGLLEHFSGGDQDTIMRHFIQMLAEDGVVITFVPNRWSPWQLIRPFFMPGIDETPFVLRDLTALNRRHGLRVLEQGGINVVPFPCSPDALLGGIFGMLLFTVASKT